MTLFLCLCGYAIICMVFSFNIFKIEYIDYDDDEDDNDDIGSD